MANFKCLPANQSTSVIGKVARPRHRSTFHQYRDHSDAALKGGRNFYTHEIFRIVEPASSFLIRRDEPTPADDRNQNITCGTTRFLRLSLNEVHARFNSIDIHENLVRSKVCYIRRS